ncbi:MAG: NADH:ubiquinone reductase (Na(+)-transporting) subunit D [Bacteroidales bacterium]|nr:NADH:ubiquinone reductase (Na(+)-transporting) subunit D [Bacteroidales bacterium]
MSNYKDTIMKSLFGSNPVTVLVLGICSALAVTVHMKEALIMGLAVTLVSAFSNLVVSALRKTIPARIRIIVELLVVSFFVILADQLLKAYAYPSSKTLSIYVGLIITNCIIMGRLESCALSHKPVEALTDGFLNGLGYALVLFVVAFFREFFGLGSIFGFQIIPQGWYYANGGFYENNGLFILPPMALILIGCIVWIQRSLDKNIQE